MSEVDAKIRRFCTENRKWLKDKASPPKQPRILGVMAQIILEEAQRSKDREISKLRVENGGNQNRPEK
ncbi:hypothetical protein AKJ62_01275 [candidate division MSBL1 archaeon SCGC-AAA259D14]|uniref:Uncharacterized protein n=1 Tax=candidate division MSBL1 archaeon SCGC-AAA259D14 TaxID=1698261 RepID=A0A133U7U8_9EURY|nr:hypothetical protein AKJ62_01275 [candidate division MSBL1 archaeon SCGC-AAA259D14]